MLKELLMLVVEKLNEKEVKESNIENRLLELVEERYELEEKYVKALADAEKWGDLSDNSHWRTAEVNKIKRLIEAKQRMIDTLKSNK